MDDLKKSEAPTLGLLTEAEENEIRSLLEQFNEGFEDTDAMGKDLSLKLYQIEEVLLVKFFF